MANVVNSIIVTHNGRIRCLLRSIDPSIDVKKIKFKNCCVLRLSIDTKQQMIGLNMIHQGELSKHSGEKKYYVDGENDNGNEISFKKYTYNGIKYNEILVNLGLMLKPNGKTYNFYIVRHGEGIHNVASQWDKITGFVTNAYIDPILTPAGMNQSQNAGSILKKHLLESNNTIDFLFCSDLRRTRETLEKMFPNIGDIMTNKTKDPEIHILPCSHELDYDFNSKQNKCYEDKFLTLLSDENKMSCYMFENSNGVGSDYCRKTNTGIKLNWSYYKEQYGNKNRSYFHGSEVCTNKTMLTHAINIIEHY